MTQRVAFVFPGQGSHRAGMVAAWAGTPFATLIEQVGEAAGLDLVGRADDADACGASTALGQPAILAVSLAAAAALQHAGVQPRVVAGHSLGEVTAAAVAGVLDVSAAGEIVGERGRAMGAACRSTPGAMAAVVKIDRRLVEGIIAAHDGVAIANENAVGQVVISGAIDSFERAVEDLRAAGARCIPLRVEGAFHSPAMAPAVVRLDAVLRRHTLADPSIPVVTGVSGAVLRSAVDIRRNLVDGVLSPVQWVAVQERLVALGVQVVIEVGPGGVLSALSRRSHPDLAVASVAMPDDIASAVDLVHGVHATTSSVASASA